MIEVKVRCGGKLHKIVLSDKGKLCLVDHDKDELLRSDAFEKFGGEACRCLRIYRLWAEKGGAIHEMPVQLYAAYVERTRPHRRWWYKWLREFGEKIPKLTTAVEVEAGPNLHRFLRSEFDAPLDLLGFKLEADKRRGISHYYVVPKFYSPSKDASLGVTLSITSAGAPRYAFVDSGWVLPVSGVRDSGDTFMLDLSPMLHEMYYAIWASRFIANRNVAREVATRKAWCDEYKAAIIKKYANGVARSMIFSGVQPPRAIVGLSWEFASPAVADEVARLLAKIGQRRQKYLKATDING